MTIRSTLLVAFLGVGLVPAILLVALSFTRTQAAMRGEIEQSLLTQAAVTAADIDKQMFERLQNAVTWAHLEVMQDLHVGDVDKRLSNFLGEMKLRYGGVYAALHALDRERRIVASSEASALGRHAGATPEGQALPLAADVVTLSLAPTAAAALVLEVPLISQFTGERLGTLQLQVERAQLQHTLDAAARHGRVLALVDAAGRLVAASPKTPSLAAGVLPADWRALPPGVAEREGAPLATGRVIAGVARDGSRGRSGLGWTTLVLQTSDAALAPVRRMALSFAGLLLAAALVIAGVAYAVSGRIARPIVELSDYARSFARKQRLPPPAPGGGEVGELNRSFVQMVDELAASQQTLVRASQLAAIGEFAAMMAHEIRTPLGILSSSAQMLEQESGLSAEGRELSGLVVGETRRLNRLVASLLDRSRAPEPQREPCDVQTLIERCLTLLGPQAGRQGVQLRRVFTARDAVAEVDAEQIVQVLLNLLNNALQALQTRPAGEGLITVTTRQETTSLLVEVADNGPGIAAADRQRIFEPFVYRREGGLGLGLAVVKQIVAAHGGDISVDAAAGGGACFRIRLPQEPMS